MFVHPKTVGRYIIRLQIGVVFSHCLDYPGTTSPKKAEKPENK